MRGGRYPGMPFNQQMSFPCELTLQSSTNGPTLCRTPVREIERLYGTRHEYPHLVLRPGENPLADVREKLLDLTAEIALDQAAEIGFIAGGGPVRYRVAGRKLSCLNKSAELEPVDGRIKLRLLVDRTSIEIFANDGRVTMSFCFLPKPAEPIIGLYAKGGPARVLSMEINELSSAWAAAPAR